MPFVERAPYADEAELLASLINKASGGVISYLLNGVAPGFSGEQLLAATIGQESETYGEEAALLLEREGQCSGLLIAYPSALHVLHPSLHIFVSAKKVTAVRPILEACVPDSLHINTFWLDESLSGPDDALLLLHRAEERAKARGLARLGAFCRSSEKRDMAFFTAQGFITDTVFAPEAVSIADRPEGGVLLRKEL